VGGGESEKGGGGVSVLTCWEDAPDPSCWEDALAPSLSTSLLTGFTKGLTLGSV
jgi:hypothetical protein